MIESVNDQYGFSFQNLSGSRLGIFRHSGSVAGTEIISVLRDSSAVGIGTTSSGGGGQPKLWAANDVTLVSGNYAGDVAAQIMAVGTTNPLKRLALMYDTTLNIGLVQAMIAGTGTSPLCLNAAGGNVGIGMTNPGYTLDVNGTVNLTGLRLNGAAGGNSLGYGAYMRGSVNTTGGVGWGAIQEYFYSAGSVANGTWTNVVPQSSLAGIRNAFVSIRMFGAWWGGIQTIVDSGYAGYPNQVYNYPGYVGGFEIRFNSGYLQVFQNSGSIAGIDILITKFAW